MKLSRYAASIGVDRQTAYRMARTGQIPAYQLPTGTWIVDDARLAKMIEQNLTRPDMGGSTQGEISTMPTTNPADEDNFAEYLAKQAAADAYERNPAVRAADRQHSRSMTNWANSVNQTNDGRSAGASTAAEHLRTGSVVGSHKELHALATQYLRSAYRDDSESAIKRAAPTFRNAFKSAYVSTLEQNKKGSGVHLLPSSGETMTKSTPTPTLSIPLAAADLPSLPTGVLELGSYNGEALTIPTDKLGELRKSLTAMKANTEVRDRTLWWLSQAQREQQGSDELAKSSVVGNCPECGGVNVPMCLGSNGTNPRCINCDAKLGGDDNTRLDRAIEYMKSQFANVLGGTGTTQNPASEVEEFRGKKGSGLKKSGYLRDNLTMEEHHQDGFNHGHDYAEAMHSTHEKPLIGSRLHDYASEYADNYTHDEFEPSHREAVVAKKTSAFKAGYRQYRQEHPDFK